MFPHETYATALASKGHGFPLWEPDPGEYAPVELGDVGHIVDGAFVKLFNASKGPEDRSNRLGLPDGHIPLRIGDILRRAPLPKNPDYISSEGISCKGADITVIAGTVVQGGCGFSFECKRRQGAVLIMGDVAHRQDVVDKGRFRDYIVNNHQSWLAFANQPELGRGLSLPDLIFVTGCDKTSDWACAAWSETTRSATLNFIAGIPGITEGNIGIWGRWESTQALDKKMGPQREISQFADTATRLSQSSPSATTMVSDAFSIDALSAANVRPSTSSTSSSVPPSTSDQCVFVRGYRMGDRSTWFMLKNQIEGGNGITIVRKPIDPRKPGGKTSTTPPASSQHETPPQNSSHEGTHCANDDTTSEELSSGDDSDSLYLQATERKTVAEAMIGFILENSDAELALVHDDDLDDLLEIAYGCEIDDYSAWIQQLNPSVFLEGDVGMFAGTYNLPNSVERNPALMIARNSKTLEHWNSLIEGLPSELSARSNGGSSTIRLTFTRQLSHPTVNNCVRSRRYYRKCALTQAKSELQSLNLSPLAPGVALCLSLVITIIESVVGVKSNQEECLRLAERVTEIACALVTRMAVQTEPITSELHRGIGQLAKILEAIKVFICQQRKRPYVSRLWTYRSDAHSIKQLNIGLETALTLFERKSHFDLQHKLEVLRLLLDDRSADGNMSLEASTSSASRAIGSSVLPAKPSIFYGRQEVVDNIIETIEARKPARVAILGAGGVGKTSLSLMVLHHLTVVQLFKSSRWFIPCGGSTTPRGLVSAIANPLGLSGDNLFERIILSFEARPTILVLDNFETPWETVATRPAIESMLSQLAAIQSLTLLITMRGSERPIGTAWTRPFIPPLTPLDICAARLTFATISDTPMNDPHIDELLNALDNLPLAITLMANLAQSESPEILLGRWHQENTAMLTRGPDHRSSLDTSIRISLDGPRMRQNPDANRVLRLLAILPLGSKDLEEIAPDMKNIRRAAAVLKQVGLAHVDGAGSLCVLAPIRRFITWNYPPDPDSWKPVQKYYENLARLGSEIEHGMNGKAIIELLSPKIPNMQAVFEYSLGINGTNFRRVIRAVINLTDLFKYTGLGSVTILDKYTKKAETMGDKALWADCRRSQAEILYSRSLREQAIAGFEQALDLYRALGDEYLSQQGRCIMMLGMLESQVGNHNEAIEHIEHAIDLHRRGGNPIGEGDCLSRLAKIAVWRQQYSDAIQNLNAATLIFQAQSYLRGQARCMSLVGIISLERRLDYADASEKVANAVQVYRYLGDSTGEANCLRILGRIALQTAKYGAAFHHLQGAMALYRKVKSVYGEADCYQAGGEVWMKRDDEASAEEHFEKAQTLFSEIDDRGGKVFCRRALGDIAFRRRRYTLARQIYEEALALSLSSLDKCRAEFGIANVALASGDSTKAQALYDKVLPVFQDHGNATLDVAYTLKKLGHVAMSVGENQKARDLFEDALLKFKVTGVVPAQADCLVHLGEVAIKQSGRKEAISRYEEAMGLYCEAEDEERRMHCVEALQDLERANPPKPEEWIVL